MGAHYCPGASLAKFEIELIFNAIAGVMPDFDAAAHPRGSGPAGSSAASTARGR